MPWWLTPIAVLGRPRHEPRAMMNTQKAAPIRFTPLRFTPLRLATLVLLTLCSACASPPKPLYGWGNYPSLTKDYLSQEGADPAQHIKALESTLRIIQGNGQQPPPGMHAHLGWLYVQAGNAEQSLAFLQQERLLFPESAAFIDGLLIRMQQTPSLAGKPDTATP